MDDTAKTKRKSKRYKTEVKVYFNFSYDVETRIKFQYKDKLDKNALSRKYTGISKNFSIEGMCFHSSQKLKKGDVLELEVFLPNNKIPINMEGEVKWSILDNSKKIDKPGYDTGLKLLTVEGKDIVDSIYYDKTYQVQWSEVLESILEKYKKIVRQRTGSKD